jgi:regulator of sirC expression with transglutaminase-like and TPR domain
MPGMGDMGCAEIMVRAAEQLQQVFEIPDHRIDLGEAALVLAQLEYPNLNVGQYVEVLDDLARQAASRLVGRYDPDRTIEQLNHFLFTELGFHGNERDYYDPRNSFLNDVLDRRTGIPITLAVVYLEITRRLGLPFYGVGLPGHFLIKYDDNRKVTFLDPFQGGRTLDRDECQDLVRSLKGDDVFLTALDFRAVDNRHIVTRMLNNLRSIYLTTRRYRKATGVMDMILSLMPASPEEVKQRAWLHYEMRHLSRARQDLETYLSLRSDAEDAESVMDWIKEIRQSLAQLN